MFHGLWGLVPYSLCPLSLVPYVLCPLSLVPYGLCPLSLVPYVLCPVSLVPYVLCPVSLVPYGLCPRSHAAYRAGRQHFFFVVPPKRLVAFCSNGSRMTRMACWPCFFSEHRSGADRRPRQPCAAWLQSHSPQPQNPHLQISSTLASPTACLPHGWRRVGILFGRLEGSFQAAPCAHAERVAVRMPAHVSIGMSMHLCIHMSIHMSDVYTSV